MRRCMALEADVLAGGWPMAQGTSPLPPGISKLRWATIAGCGGVRTQGQTLPPTSRLATGGLLSTWYGLDERWLAMSTQKRTGDATLSCSAEGSTASRSKMSNSRNRSKWFGRGGTDNTRRSRCGITTCRRRPLPFVHAT